MKHFLIIVLMLALAGCVTNNRDGLSLGFEKAISYDDFEFSFNTCRNSKDQETMNVFINAEKESKDFIKIDHVSCSLWHRKWSVQVFKEKFVEVVFRRILENQARLPQEFVHLEGVDKRMVWAILDDWDVLGEIYDESDEELGVKFDDMEYENVIYGCVYRLGGYPRCFGWQSRTGCCTGSKLLCEYEDSFVINDIDMIVMSVNYIKGEDRLVKNIIVKRKGDEWCVKLADAKVNRLGF